MKFKSLFLVGILLLTFLSVSVVCADDTIVFGNSSFTIPEGFTVVDNSNQMLIYNDTVTITLYQGPIIDPALAKEKRIDMGYDFLGEKNYTFGGATINQQNYNSEGVNSCVYTFKKNNKTFIITLNVDEDYPVPELGDNPVSGIIKSLT